MSLCRRSWLWCVLWGTALAVALPAVASGSASSRRAAYLRIGTVRAFVVKGGKLAGRVAVTVPISFRSEPARAARDSAVITVRDTRGDRIAHDANVELRPPCLERRAFAPCIDHFFVLTKNESARARMADQLRVSIKERDRSAGRFVDEDAIRTVTLRTVAAGLLSPQISDSWSTESGAERLLYFGTSQAGRRYLSAIYADPSTGYPAPCTAQPKLNSSSEPESGFVVDDKFAMSGDWGSRVGGAREPGGPADVTGRIVSGNELGVSWKVCRYRAGQTTSGVPAGSNVKFVPN